MPRPSEVACAALLIAACGGRVEPDHQDATSTGIGGTIAHTFRSIVEAGGPNHSTTSAEQFVAGRAAMIAGGRSAAGDTLAASGSVGAAAVWSVGGAVHGGSGGGVGMAGSGATAIFVSTSAGRASAASGAAWGGIASTSFHATGGLAQAGANAAGTAGVSSTLPPDGYYELAIEAWNSPIGYDCGPLFAGTKLILLWQKLAECAADSVDCYRARMSRGTLVAEQFAPSAIGRDRNTLVMTLDATEQTDFLSETLVRITLGMDQGRFTNIGKATLERSCNARERIRYDRKLVVTEDDKGPTLSVRCRPYLQTNLVTWAPVTLQADEPLGSGADYDCSTSNSCFRLFDLDWVDAASTSSRPTIAVATHYPSVQLRDPAQASGKSFKLVLDNTHSHRDLAGNTPIDWPATFDFVEDQPLQGRLDFDQQAPIGLVGQSEWLVSDTMDLRCESGRCLMLGPIQPCLLPQAPLFQSVRFAAISAKSLRVRLAIETDIPKADVSPLLIVGQAATFPSLDVPTTYPAVSIEEHVQSVTYHAKAFPDGVFTHTSGSVTYDVPLTWPEPRGAALAIHCGTLFSPVNARLLVEWWELVP